MRKLLFYIFGAFVTTCALSSCGDDDDDNSSNVWEKYAENREANINWLNSEEARTNADGTPYFERIIPAWNKGSYILMHRFTDPAETAGNLVPLYTSSVSVRYIGRNYQGVVFDADSLSANGTTFTLSGLVSGWQVALQNMHVGDSVEIVLPYQMAYGSSSPSSAILPYSALRFNLRLLDIPAYEIRP